MLEGVAGLALPAGAGTRWPGARRPAAGGSAASAMLPGLGFQSNQHTDETGVNAEAGGALWRCR